MGDFRLAQQLAHLDYLPFQILAHEIRVGWRQRGLVRQHRRFACSASPEPSRYRVRRYVPCFSSGADNRDIAMAAVASGRRRRM
jgi:hypothetical protein